MAIEMAKLSLWLILLDAKRPFTFLDHAWDQPGYRHGEQPGAGILEAGPDMCRFAFDLIRNFLQPATQGGQVAFTLLFARFIAPQIEHELRSVLTFQLCLNGALQFGHHRLELVHLFLGQFFEVLLEILGAFDAAGFEPKESMATPFLLRGTIAGWSS